VEHLSATALHAVTAHPQSIIIILLLLFWIYEIEASSKTIALVPRHRRVVASKCFRKGAAVHGASSKMHSK
jgi:hypothetical protein